MQRYLDAMRYGDRASLFDLHVSSTDQSEWCRQEFENLLTKAQAEVRTEDCQRVRSLTETDLAQMRDELRLAVQVSGWSCENPKGTCRDYSKTVFEQALDGHPLVKDKPTALVVRRLFGDEETAAAYVDVTTAQGTTQHMTLELRHVGAGWRVAKGFFPQ